VAHINIKIPKLKEVRLSGQSLKG